MLTDGYDPDVFVDGPLISAMREGALLYVEEINRIPEETLNVLITVMSERELHVPRLGRVAAAAGFRLVAAMNPFDAIGTARISGAVYDRVCRLSVSYQSAAEESAIVAALDHVDGPGVRRSGSARRSRSCAAPAIIAELRVGSSVRGAIDAERRRRVAGRSCAAAGRRSARSGSMPRWSRCPVGSGSAKAAPARARRSSPSCGRQVFGRVETSMAATRRVTAREKLQPRRGPPAPR